MSESVKEIDMKAGIIGFGRMGETHARAYAAHGVEVVALAGGNPDKARAHAERIGLKASVYDDPEEMLRRNDVGIVSVCSPHEFHAGQTFLAAQAGKHIIVEKPIGMSVPQLNAAAGQVSKAGVRTGVCFVWRWLSAFAQMYREKAHCGELLTLNIALLNGQHHGKPKSPREPGTPRGDISTVLSSGCHAIDMGCWFAGSKVASVRSLTPYYTGGVQRTSILLLWFESGAIGVVTTSDENFCPLTLRLEYVGRDGRIYDDMDYDDVRLYCRSGPDEYRTLGPTLPAMARKVVTLPFKEMIGEYLADISAGRDTSVNFAYAVHVHEVCFAAERSAAKGGEAVTV